MDADRPRRSPYAAPSHPAERHIPAVVTFLHPFRIVPSSASPEWSPTVEQINRREWDYITLHEIVGGLDVGLPAPAHMVVGFDGALALPPIESVERTIELFNRSLAAVLLGGIYCEAVGLRDVAEGYVVDWQFIRLSSTTASSRPNLPVQFHEAVRQQMASPMQAIVLTAPQRLAFGKLHDAHGRGRELLSLIPELSPEYLLKGVTAIAHRDWSSVLSNMAITLEQITSHLWRRKVTGDGDAAGIPGRAQQLSDTRTWTAATRQELLYQTGVLDRSTLAALFVARQARNALVHRGETPTETAARASFDALRGLLERGAVNAPVPLFQIDLDDHALLQPFPVQGEEPQPSPTHWLPVPPLPGEKDALREHREWMESRRERTPVNSATSRT